MSLLAGLLALALAGPPAAATGPYAWVVSYWMAYDNDLSSLSEPIVEMLQQGVQDPSIAVTVHIDRRGPGGMERVVITHEGTTRTPLPELEASAAVDLLARELDHVRWTLPAERYGVVFLDHGGRLSEMSADEHGPSAWLDPREVAPVLERFDEQASGELELLFVQQCGKASLETLHLFGRGARTLVASEAIIGAPNFYYPTAFQELSRQPDQDGEALGRAMVAADRPDMFATYTVLDGQALQALPERLDRVLAPVLALGDTLRWSGEPAPVFTFHEERYHDLVGLLTALYFQNGLDLKPLWAFQRWWERDVLSLLEASPRVPGILEQHSGASVLVPTTPGMLERYADLPLYQQSRLDELMALLLRR